ncbi:hypothetical protein [Marilutibacter maris]|uniref:hypothetical protein n=1 Tax=Marilutibacter maris TaxID=1605891 RepID=UPI0011AE73CC|nr:hypothetical protein [Lysobacter maris]
MRSRGSSQESLARIALMAFVAALHLYASWWLLFRFQIQPPPLAVDRDEEAVLQVHFIARSSELREPAPPVAASPVTVRRSAEAVASPEPSATRGISAVFLPASSEPATPRRPLDLSVPERREPIGFDRPDPLASRASLDPRRTRFADDWATDGDAVEKLKEDSRVARTLLGLFGGRDTCTEQAIRERRDDCVGADYRPGLHEVLQGR